MEEFDVKEFARMFDAALASDNPAVKKALRNFMMVAAIVHAQELDSAEQPLGPLETLLKKVSDLERLYWDLKNTNTISTNGNYWKDAHIQTPTWVYKPATSVSTTSSSTTAIGKDLDVQDIYTYLKDLNFK